MIGLIGSKIGITRVFIEDGTSIPVTIIKAEDNLVTQVKNIESDGYNAIQVTVGNKKVNHIKKSEVGHFAKAGVKVGCVLHEFHLIEDETFDIGKSISIEIFANIKKVDITGTSKGKGFAGTVKRWNFSTQDATHGNSLSHRVPGSIGQNQTPGRVFKGKKMPGQLGNKCITIQNLNIVYIDVKRSLMMIKGSVPGVIGSYLIIKPAVKKQH